MDWKTQYNNQISLIEELREVLEGNGNLKFNRSYLIVSDIASQAYCEEKVELNYIHGAVEKEEKITGTELHEEVSRDAIIVNFEEMIKDIHKKDIYSILETTFMIKYKGEFIVGKPDYIVFRKGIPIFIFDYKFSKYRKIFPNQHVQARIYGLILKEMGFNTNILFYGIIKGPLELKQDIETLKSIPAQVERKVDLDLLLEKGEMILEFNQIIVYIHKFEPSQAEKDLDWAIEYWKGERSATLTDNKNKCLNCEHKQNCRAWNENID